MQRFRKLVILGTLGITDYAQQNWETLFQLIGIRDAYLYTQNQVHTSLLAQDIAKILQTCYLRYFKFARLWPKKMMAEYNLEFQGSIQNLQKRTLFMKFYPEMP